MNKRSLFVVVPDLDAENVVKTLLLKRQNALNIQVDFIADSHPNGDLMRYAKRDSGCYKDAVNLLRPPQRTHNHAMIIFDRDGCGAESQTRDEIELEIESQLHANGWSKDRVAVVVIEPELEAWIWAPTPRVSSQLGWESVEAMRSFLKSKRLWDANAPKPRNPKEAMKLAMREKRQTLSARVFEGLATSVGLTNCQDVSFLKFRDTLQRWFPR